MPIVTEIRPQVKDKLRVSLFLDGRFFCGMKLETVVRAGIKVGREIGEDELGRLQMENERSEALDKAMNCLSHSMKTRREVERYLADRGYLPEVIAAAADKLEEYGYLDDEAYSEYYVRAARGKKGSRLIRAELMRRGVSAEEAERAAESADDEESARALAAKYLRGKTFSPEIGAKAYRYLLGKGFDYDTARAAVAAAAEEDGDEDD